MGSLGCQFDFTGTDLPTESVTLLDGAFSVKYYLSCIVKQKKVPINSYYELNYLAALQKQPVIPLKSEVGAENALQIEIDCPNTNLDIVNDVFVGRVHFVTAQKKMEEMKILLKRKEAYRFSATEQPVQNDWKDVMQYQVMDGAPVRNEVIPIKIRLSQIPNLTSSFKTETAKIEYQILICVIDTDGQSYFKDVPVQFYRG